MNIAFFIQARLGSTRLPRKVLLPFVGDSCILDILIEKLKKNFSKVPLYICTSVNSHDDEIENFCLMNNVNFFRGNENNVLKRFTDAALDKNVDVIIRICADNPFLDIDFLKELIVYYKQNPNADYWSFKNFDNVPVIKTHFGFFAEIVTVKALQKVNLLTNDSIYLEHVTNYIYSHKEFDCELKSLPNFLLNRNDLRFTIDDENDFNELQSVYQYYKSVNYDLRKTISYVDKNNVILNSMIHNIKKYSK
jgi:spore coat polysaccharide biosynthesis protein SpsF